MKLIGPTIKNIRRVNSLTQEQLGEKLGVSRVQVNQYESGKSTPSLEVVIKLSELFDISIDSIINGNIEFSSDGSESMITRDGKQHYKDETEAESIDELKYIIQIQKSYIKELEAKLKGKD